MEYSIMNESLRFNCFPIVITLLNLANINSKSKDKIIIRIITLIHGIIGCFVLWRFLPGEIGVQVAFEWVMLYSVGFIPFFEVFLGKLYNKVDKYIEKKEKSHGIIYSEEEKRYSESVTDRITSLGNVVTGIIIFTITVSPVFDKFIDTTSDLYALAKYNFIILALSCFGLYIKKNFKVNP